MLSWRVAIPADDTPAGRAQILLLRAPGHFCCFFGQWPFVPAVQTGAALGLRHQCTPLPNWLGWCEASSGSREKSFLGKLRGASEFGPVDFLDCRRELRERHID